MSTASEIKVDPRMRPVRWTFDGEKIFGGFTDDSRWNGWLNVWVTPVNGAESSGAIHDALEEWEKGRNV